MAVVEGVGPEAAVVAEVAAVVVVVVPQHDNTDIELFDVQDVSGNEFVVQVVVVGLDIYIVLVL